MDEGEAAAAGSVAACVARLARHEQRALLGLVPLPRLPTLLAQVLKDCFATLANDVEVSARATSSTNLLLYYTNILLYTAVRYNFTVYCPLTSLQ